MHGNVLLTCNSKLSKYFSSNQANVELTEDKHEDESKHEELAGNFIGSKIYSIWKDNIAFNKDIDKRKITGKSYYLGKSLNR